MDQICALQLKIIGTLTSNLASTRRYIDVVQNLKKETLSHKQYIFSAIIQAVTITTVLSPSGMWKLWNLRVVNVRLFSQTTQKIDAIISRRDFDWLCSTLSLFFLQVQIASRVL